MKMSNSKVNCVYAKHNYLGQNLKSEIHQQLLIPTIKLLTQLNLHHLKTMAVPLSPNQKPEVGAVNQGNAAGHITVFVGCAAEPPRTTATLRHRAGLPSNLGSIVGGLPLTSGASKGGNR